MSFSLERTLWYHALRIPLSRYSARKISGDVENILPPRIVVFRKSEMFHQFDG